MDDLGQVDHTLNVFLAYLKHLIDLIARCQPAPGSEDPLWGLSTVDICTQTVSYILEDGWKSFPSGHSSSMSNTFLLVVNHSSDEYEVSFAGLGFLAFYLAGKLHLFDNRGHAVSPNLLCGKPSMC